MFFSLIVVVESLRIHFIDEDVCISTHKDHEGLVIYIFYCWKDVKALEIVVTFLLDILAEFVKNTGKYTTY